MGSSIPNLSVDPLLLHPLLRAPALGPAAAAPSAAATPASAPAATTAHHSVFTSGSTRPRQRSEASKLKFPIDVPDVVKSAIANFLPSDRQCLAKVNHRKHGSIYYWGLRLETKPEGDWEFSYNKPKERAQLWICHGDDRCRNPKRAIEITNKQTSCATTHLDTQHKVKCARTTVAKQKSVPIYTT